MSGGERGQAGEAGVGGVLFVLPTLEVGGTERHVAALAADLAARGVPVTVACLTRGGPLAAGVRAAGARVEVLGTRGVRDPLAPARLLAWIARHRPAVVHAFLSGFDAMAALPARLARVPCILGSRREVAWWMQGRHLAAAAAGTALVDRVVCCAEAVRREALAQEGGDPARYVVVRNGVDLRRFAPAPPARRAAARAALDLAPGDVAFVTVANLDVEKGHDVLLEAAARLHAALPVARFLCAGQGPLAPALDRQIADLRLGATVRRLGHVDDVPHLLAAADAFVLPSRHEGLPNALLEAMAAGLACVASDTGGIPEVDGGTGAVVLVRPGSADDLGQALLRVGADAALRCRLGAAARARAASAFDLESALAAHRVLYGETTIGDVR